MGMLVLEALLLMLFFWCLFSAVQHFGLFLLCGFFHNFLFRLLIDFEAGFNGNGGPHAWWANTRASAVNLECATNHVGLRLERNRKIMRFFNTGNFTALMVQSVNHDVRR